MIFGLSSAELGLLLIGGIFSVLWYLLKQKDAKQQEEIKLNKASADAKIKELQVDADAKIKDLQDKHQEDATKLTTLELHIAKNHFEKGDVTAMFASFKSYLDEKFKELRESVDAIDDRRHSK
jgi:hypothetical protein